MSDNSINGVYRRRASKTSATNELQNFTNFTKIANDLLKEIENKSQDMFGYDQRLELEKQMYKQGIMDDELRAKARAALEKNIAEQRARLNKEEYLKDLQYASKRINYEKNQEDERHQKAINNIMAENALSEEDRKKQLDEAEAAHKKAMENIELEYAKKKEEAEKLSEEIYKNDLKVDKKLAKEKKRQRDKEAAEQEKLNALLNGDKKAYNKAQVKLNRLASQEALENSKSGKIFNEIGSGFSSISSGFSAAKEGFSSGGSLSEILGTAGEAISSIASGISSVVNALGSILTIFGSIDQSFKEAENAINTYQGKIDSRLQGAEGSYAEMAQSIDDALTKTPVVKQTAVLQQLSSLVSSGITSNVEQRAFIATVADEIVSSFEATRAGMEQLIRIQAEDSTAARLGLQSSLQTMLNSQFQNTEYITDAFNPVADALVEAESTMTTTAATEFEYAVQKWLGALYSVGVDQGTVTSIATMLNKLGTGDISSLSEQELVLLGMSANRSSGKSLTQLLKDGLDASDANELLSSMVDYLQDIADNTNGNNVLKSAWGSVLNLSLTDLQAVNNLSNSTLNNIKNTSLSYEDMWAEANYQTSTGVISRMATGQLVNNMFSNLMYSSANNLVTDPINYLTYKIADFGADLLGGVATTPGKILTAIKTAEYGVSFIMELIDSAGGMMSSLLTNLSSHTGIGSYSKTTSILQLLSNISYEGTGSRFTGDVSTSYYAGSEASDKVSDKAKNTEKENKEISQEWMEETGTYDETSIYNSLFSSSDKGQLTAIRDNVSATKEALTAVYDSSQKAMRVVVTGFDTGSFSENGIPIKFSNSGYSQTAGLLDKVSTVAYSQNINTILSEITNETTESGIAAINVNLAGSDVSLGSLELGSTASSSSSLVRVGSNNYLNQNKMVEFGRIT